VIVQYIQMTLDGKHTQLHSDDTVYTQYKLTPDYIQLTPGYIQLTPDYIQLTPDYIQLTPYTLRRHRIFTPQN
jgi:hypothetical protein